MTIWAGFLRRDSHSNMKKDQLMAVQDIEPRGGDLEIMDWAEIDEPDLLTARVNWGPVSNDIIMLARYKRTEAGKVVKATENRDGLRAARDAMLARKNARLTSGLPEDPVESAYAQEIGREVDSTFVRAIKWVLGR